MKVIIHQPGRFEIELVERKPAHNPDQVVDVPGIQFLNVLRKVGKSDVVVDLQAGEQLPALGRAESAAEDLVAGRRFHGQSVGLRPFNSRNIQFKKGFSKIEIRAGLLTFHRGGSDLQRHAELTDWTPVSQDDTRDLLQLLARMAVEDGGLDSWGQAFRLAWRPLQTEGIVVESSGVAVHRNRYFVGARPEHLWFDRDSQGGARVQHSVGLAL